MYIYDYTHMCMLAVHAYLYDYTYIHMQKSEIPLWRYNVHTDEGPGSSSPKGRQEPGLRVGIALRCR